MPLFYAAPREKPGTCPTKIPKIFCRDKKLKDECKYDRHCKDDLKCCPWSCGKACVTPGKSPSGIFKSKNFWK